MRQVVLNAPLAFPPTLLAIACAVNFALASVILSLKDLTNLWLDFKGLGHKL
jgi:hypothetical protein